MEVHTHIKIQKGLCPNRLPYYSLRRAVVKLITHEMNHNEEENPAVCHVVVCIRLQKKTVETFFFIRVFTMSISWLRNHVYENGYRLVLVASQYIASW